MLIKKREITVDRRNKRLKAMNLRKGENPREFESIAKEERLEKIILFESKENKPFFLENGYKEEGKIDGYFNGTTAHILTKYLDKNRKQTDNLENENQILDKIESIEQSKLKQLPTGYSIRTAQIEDIPEIIDVFNQVFESYPTPMNDEGYVEKAINANVDMVVVEKKNEIVGLSSAEIDYEHKNAEITDCATLPSERGKGLMNHMIQALERQMKKKEIVNLFSIARARSFGMNKVLYNLDYAYRGRLINNVHIAGNWENMNIWVKRV